MGVRGRCRRVTRGFIVGRRGCVRSLPSLPFLPSLNELTCAQVDLFAKDVVIVPINLGNSHWVCSAINIARKRFEYYDSLGSRNPLVYKVRSSLLSGIESGLMRKQRLREYLAAEHLRKKGSVLDLSDWEDYWDEVRARFSFFFFPLAFEGRG